jgi:hypothetical protein
MQITSPNAPALPKPSLLARKDIRDEFDPALPDLTKTINDLLKATTYTIDINFPQLYAHCVAADSGQNYIGSTAKVYLEGFVYNLKKYTDEVSPTHFTMDSYVLTLWLLQGEFNDAIQTFNDIVTIRKITIAADDKFTYEGCSIKNSVLEINYNSKSFGTNNSYACSNLAKEIDKGPCYEHYFTPRCTDCFIFHSVVLQVTLHPSIAR